jgi:predicted Zn-dependent peptidase
VPVYSVEAPGPRRAVLAFRVGRADETLAWAGLTHLVEHLALFSFKEQPYAYGGQVEGARTLFYVQGSDTEIQEFLHRLCENLRALPLDRLADEARLLETEAQSRQGGALGSLLGGRYGCQGWGLIGYPEYALKNPDPDRLTAWANEWFTADNAVLGLSGPMDPPPIDLRPGRRMASPALTPLSLVRTPAWFHDREQGVGMSFVGPDSFRFPALMRMLQRHGLSRLRFGESISYEVASATLRLGATSTHGILLADGLPENLSKVLNGMLAVLDELMVQGPTEAELREDVDAVRRSIENPGWAMAMLDGYLTNDLFGTTIWTVDEAIAELEKATPQDYAALLREVFPSLLTIVPSGVTVLDRRLTAVPEWSTDEAHGTVYRLRAATSVVAQQMTSLTVGDTAVSLRLGPGKLVTIPYSECVAALAWDGGSRTLLSRDSFRLHVRPDDWKGGAEIAKALERHLPADVLVPAGPRPNPDPEILSGDRPPEKAKRQRVDWTRALITLITGAIMISIYVIVRAITAGH